MNLSIIRYWTALSMPLLLACALTAAETNKSQSATNKIEISIFPDKNLEAAVRMFVFEKRDNDKPITEADVVSLSTINGSGMQIKNLTGLDKCKSLASLDLSKNQISKLDPLKDLKNIQYLNLANNQVSDISPVLKMTRLSSLYLENNRVESIKGIEALRGLMSLSLSKNKISDISPVAGLDNLYWLFLDNNKISDLTPLANSAKKDYEGEKRFSPYLNLFVAGNPLSSLSKKQLSTMKDYGTRVNN